MASATLKIQLAGRTLRLKRGIKIGGVIDGHEPIPAAVKQEEGRCLRSDLPRGRCQGIRVTLLSARTTNEVHHQPPIVELQQVAG